MKTLDILINKYGPTLTIAQLGEVLHKSEGTLANDIGAGRCPVPTYKEGGKRVASATDVAEYLDKRAAAARKEHATLVESLQPSGQGGCTFSGFANRRAG